MLRWNSDAHACSQAQFPYRTDRPAEAQEIKAASEDDIFFQGCPIYMYSTVFCVHFSYKAYSIVYYLMSRFAQLSLEPDALMSMHGTAKALRDRDRDASGMQYKVIHRELPDPRTLCEADTALMTTLLLLLTPSR